MGHVAAAPFASYSVRKNRLSLNISVVYFERKTARARASALAYDDNNIFFVLNILNDHGGSYSYYCAKNSI